jgi:hypothetical protein
LHVAVGLDEIFDLQNRIIHRLRVIAQLGNLHAGGGVVR